MILIPDVSEFQPDCNWSTFLAAGNKAAIARAYNGFRADKIWPQRRDSMRQNGIPVRLYYAYLVSTIDPVVQARTFCNLVGNLVGDEAVVLDHEEGQGDQTSRADEFLGVCDEIFQKKTWIYSYYSFYKNNLGGGTQRWFNEGRPVWLANYTYDYNKYPGFNYTLYQYSNHEQYVGLPPNVDSSYFPGSLQDLQALVGDPTTIPGPPPSPPVSNLPWWRRWHHPWQR